jgi:hypothetical protein
LTKSSGISGRFGVGGQVEGEYHLRPGLAVRDPLRVAAKWVPWDLKGSFDMPSMQTIFRAVVMVVVGAIVVKGWMLYGPTNEQVKKTYAQGKELVNSFIDSHQQGSSNEMTDPRLAPPRPAMGNSGSASVATASPLAPPTPMAQTEAPKLLPESAATPSMQATPAPTAPGATASPFDKSTQATDSTDRVSELISHLRQLGAAETNLTPWGGGKMYRFSCRAPLTSAPAMTQHFESVAAEPEKAVAEVVAKVEAWRVAQRDMTRRY